MIKKAKIFMKNGASIDVNVDSVEKFNELADSLAESQSLFKINDSCQIDATDISIISYVEENTNE